MTAYRKIELVTDAAAEVWTVAEFLANDEYFKSVDFSNSETAAYFTNTLIPAARQAAEMHLGRALINQTWRITFDFQPAFVQFPKGKLQSVTTVKTIAEDGTETTEDSSYYTVEAGEPGIMWLNSGYSWTSTTRAYGQMKIDFVVGYGAAASSIPVGIKKAIAECMVDMYENRGGEKSNFGQHFKSLPEKIWAI